MAGEIQELFIKYQKKYPLYNQKALVDMMLADGVITAEVAKEINAGTSLFLLDNSFGKIQNNAFTQDFTIKDVFGAKFTTTNKNNSTPPKNQYPLPYKFKIEKADGNNAYIIPSQFELPALLKTFNQALFDIKKENNVIVITDKKTNKTVFKVETITDDFGNKTYNIYQYADNKETVTEINTNFDEQGKRIGLFNSKKVLNKDGSYTVSMFQYGTNLVSLETFYDKNDTEKWNITYDLHGRKYKKEYSDGKVENYLVNELIKDITVKTTLGLPTTRDTLKPHIKEMEWYHVGEVLPTYYETTGRDLISDINAEIGLPKKLRKELCEHIIEKSEESPMLYDNNFRSYLAKILDKDMNSNPPSENFNYHISMAAMLPRKEQFFKLYKDLNNGKDFLKEINNSYFLKNNGKKELFDEDYSKYYGAEGAKYLADLIDDDISGQGSGKLEKHIKFITPENVEQVLKSYTRPKVLGVNVEKILKFFNVEEDEYEYVSTLEPLLTAIYSEYGLSEEKRYELMNHVFEQLKQYDRDKLTYYDDIVEDLNSHMTDSVKRPVDLMRLDNRLMSGRSRDTSYWEDYIKQGGTGDCWLLAGVISILNRNGGDALLDKIVVSNNSGSGFIVNLKGVNKKIEVSYDEIEKMSHLASGNMKAIAIEIAIDRYLKELAYTGKDSKVDINGNNTDLLYKLILGNGERCNPKDIKDINEFNNPNKVYSIGFSKLIGEKNSRYPNLGEDENGNKVDIIRNHAYAIKGSDKEYLYLINPWNSTAVIKVKWEDIKKLPIPKPNIYSANI